MNSQISLIVEIPEALHKPFLEFLDSRPDWDQDRVMAAALALFLLQNRPSCDRAKDSEISRIYLDSLFKRPVEAL